MAAGAARIGAGGWRASPSLRHGAAAVLLLGAATAVYLRTLPSFGMFIWDEAEYAALSRSVLRGEGFAIGGAPNALRPPLLPLAGAASMWLRGAADDHAARLATVALAVVGLAVVMLLGRAVGDAATGLLAAFLLGTMPEFWTMTARFLSEIPFLAFFAAAVAGFDLGLRRDPRWFWFSWVAWALALMTRYTAVLFAPYVVLRLLAGALLRRDAERRRWISAPFCLAPLLAALLVAPWLLRQYLAFGDPLVGFQQASQQLQIYLPSVSMPWDYYLVRLPSLLSPPTTALLVLGVAVAAWRHDDAVLTQALVIAGLLLWFSCYRYKEPRLVTSILPFAAIVAAAGVTRLLHPPWRPLLIPLAAAVLLWSHAFVQPVFRHWVPLGYPPFLEAMAWVRERSAPDAVILGASTPQTAWYADRRAVAFPPEPELRAALAGSAWVVFTSFERGQPPYAAALAQRIAAAPARADVVVFRDSRFAVLVAHPAAVAAHLGD